MSVNKSSRYSNIVRSVKLVKYRRYVFLFRDLGCIRGARYQLLCYCASLSLLFIRCKITIEWQ